MVGGHYCSLPSITCPIASRTVPFRQEKQTKKREGLIFLPQNISETCSRAGIGGVTWLVSSCHSPEHHKAALLVIVSWSLDIHTGERGKQARPSDESLWAGQALSGYTLRDIKAGCPLAEAG